MADQVQTGRSAFARQAWAQAFAAFAATPATSYGPATSNVWRWPCVHMLGQDDERRGRVGRPRIDATAEANAPAEAARCSFWLALCMLLRGQPARAGGWLSRTERIIGAEPDCTAAGYLMIPGLLNALHNGDFSGARAMAVRATEIGSRFGDPDLHAFGTLGHGQALIAMGETTAGFALLDEVMLSVTAGEVGPITSGIVYCRGHPRVHELVRPHASVRVDQGAQCVVRCTARPGAVSRPMSRPPITAAAACR